MKLTLNKTWITLLTMTYLVVISFASHATNQGHADTTGQVKSVKQRPNILWLVFEDMSPILPDYGDDTVRTPNISELAAEGVKYTNVHSTSGVCAPSRAAIALGMYPSGVGANNMRTHSNTKETGLPKYQAVPPASAKMLSQYLREEGYYTTNNYKTDYQFNAPRSAWNESGVKAHWRNRQANQPFFSVVNFTTTHESGLFEPYGIRKNEMRHYFSDDRTRISQLPKSNGVKTTGDETPIHLPQNTQFTIPPYLPDTPLVQRDMWKMYNNLVEADQQMGAVLKQLKDDGLYDNTIIVFYSDHGGPLPRQKRLIYDSGLKVPMIIRYPQTAHKPKQDDQLISFIDFAPTTLAMAGLPIPEHMHGQSFLDNKKRHYIHAAADRFDGFTDNIRAVKNEQFKYIRNYRPEQGYYLPVTYREKIPTMQELLRLRGEGQLTEHQAQWFRASKPEEELFDTINDPHELHNLAQNPKHESTLITLRQEMDDWLTAIDDQPNLPERQLISQLWQGNKSMPITAKPTISSINGKFRLSSSTEGAVISYQILNEAGKSTSHSVNDEWHVYQSEIALTQGQTLQAVARRIGFEQSEMVRSQINETVKRNAP